MTEAQRLAQAEQDRAAKRLALRLSAASALAGANASVIFATEAILGVSMAPSPGLATLPLTSYVVGLALGTLPIGWIARRYGRKPALLVGSLSGVFTGALATAAAPRCSRCCGARDRSRSTS